jgi:hypothetical protein
MPLSLSSSNLYVLPAWKRTVERKRHQRRILAAARCHDDELTAGG